jgi:hypothetical protein
MKGFVGTVLTMTEGNYLQIQIPIVVWGSHVINMRNPSTESFDPFSGHHFSHGQALVFESMLNSSHQKEAYGDESTVFIYATHRMQRNTCDSLTTQPERQDTRSTNKHGQAQPSIPFHRMQSKLSPTHPPSFNRDYKTF